MRNLVAIGAIGAALLASGAAGAQTPNVAGVWHVTGKIVYGKAFVEVSPTCDFIQNGAQLGGSCTGPSATGAITGVASGRSVTWTWFARATNAVGINGVCGFNGTIVGPTTIQGQMTSTASAGRGTFTQTR